MIVVDGKIRQIARVLTGVGYATAGYVMTDNGPKQFWPDAPESGKHGIVISPPAPGIVDYLCWQHMVARTSGFTTTDDSNFNDPYYAANGHLERYFYFVGLPVKEQGGKRAAFIINLKADGPFFHYYEEFVPFECQLIGNIIYIPTEALPYLPLYVPGDTLEVSAACPGTGYIGEHTKDGRVMKHRTDGLERRFEDFGREAGDEISYATWMLPLLPTMSGIAANYKKGRRKKPWSYFKIFSFTTIPNGVTSGVMGFPDGFDMNVFRDTSHASATESGDADKDYTACGFTVAYASRYGNSGIFYPKYSMFNIVFSLPIIDIF